MSLTFWFQDRMGLTPAFMMLSRLGQYPVTMDGPGLRMPLSTAVPFAVIAFYPSTLLLGREEYRMLALLTLGAGAAFFDLDLTIWHMGFARYENAGS